MKKVIFFLIFFYLGLKPVSAAPRYISLAPSTTEILFALGLSDEIVGVSSYCNYPPQTKAKSRVGDFSHPNVEKIIFLNPDYIFCTGLEQAPVIERLKRLKFNVYVSDPNSIKELFVSIKEIGRITNKTEAAEELIRNMENDIEMVSSKVRRIASEKKVKVFIEIWHEPLMTAGKNSFIDELITLAGGVNIAHDIERPYSIFSSEKIVKLNPGCIIMAYMDKESPLKLVEGRFGWDKIDAVTNKRIFNDIDPDTLLRPGPRVTEGLKELFKRLYQ